MRDCRPSSAVDGNPPGAPGTGITAQTSGNLCPVGRTCWRSGHSRATKVPLETLLAQQKSEQANSPNVTRASSEDDRHRQSISVTEERSKIIDLAIADLKTRLEKVVDSRRSSSARNWPRTMRLRLRISVEYNIRKQKACFENSSHGNPDRLSQTTRPRYGENPCIRLTASRAGARLPPNWAASLVRSSSSVA